MDLKIQDVAQLLDVSESTVKRWISECKIPYYRLHEREYRFSLDEIENWMINCKQDKGFSPFAREHQEHRLGSHQFGLYRAVHKGGIYIDVEGESKKEVICNAMQQIASNLRLDAQVITDLLLDREKLMPTALSNGIGVPHTRDFLLQESYDVVAVVFPKKPVDYGALDGKPVHTLFFLFACDDKRHLHLLAKLAHLSSRPDNLAFLKKKPDKGILLDYIKTWESQIKPKQESSTKRTALV